MNDGLGDKRQSTLARLANARRASKHEVDILREAVEDLQEEMQEARRLNRRLAELLDIVQELLVPIAQRDEEKVQKYLDSHSSGL